MFNKAAVAQLAEHILGKDEVMGSNPISSSSEERKVSYGLYKIVLWE